ncbi:MAG: hypothetical protein MUF54_00110 [Polyangiaceae bacterium]|nr:hypothetical protein [Polyangiaceae bacterium]
MAAGVSAWRASAWRSGAWRAGAWAVSESEAPQVFVLQGGSGDNSKRRRLKAPRQSRRKLAEEIERVIPRAEPAPIVLPEPDVDAIIREQVAAFLQAQRTVPAPKARRIVNRTVNQGAAPPGWAAVAFGVPAVIEDVTPIILARKEREDEEALLMAAYHHFYREAA